jgi:hypothetical protein
MVKTCWNTVAAYDFLPLGVSFGPFSEKKLLEHDFQLINVIAAQV